MGSNCVDSSTCAYDDYEQVMPWIKPECSKNDLYRAGRNIFSLGEAVFPSGATLETVDRWRLAHALPLSMVGSALKKDAIRASGEALVTNRLKRFESIRKKLVRGDVTDLSTMQDIGGCRAVLPTLDELRAAQDFFLQRNCKTQRVKDYIENPRRTGYRAVHVVVEYAGRSRHEHDGMHIEVQLRTPLQHRWAAAVETLSFLGKRGELKAGRGDQPWLDFLSTMAEVYELADKDRRVDGKVSVPDKLRMRVAEFERILHVDQFLQAFYSVSRGKVVAADSSGKVRELTVYLIAVEPNSTSISTYGLEHIEEANARCLELEKHGFNAVIVFAEDLKAIRAGYPSYFSDISRFASNCRSVGKHGLFDV